MKSKQLVVNKMVGDSTNSQTELLEFLQSRAPEIFSEGKIDEKKLRLTLGESLEEGEERYGLNWAGKMDCFKRIQETTTNTLKPCREESVDFDKTQNMFIEGDNLQVLKTLQRSYYGKVKMIYIDPPYNTGNDFVYNDAFGEVRKEYLKKAGAIDEDGNVLEDGLYHRNTKDGGHYHSNWLNMMYPRLFLARNLLRQDGVIFVSIDDNEVKNLRGIMDEIFGEENFVGQLIWKRRQNVDSRTKTGLSSDHEYAVVYSKNEAGRLRGGAKDMTKYSNPDKDPRGDWMSADMTGLATEDQRPNLHYNVTDPKTGIVYQCPQSGWRYEPKRMKILIENNEVIFPLKSDGRPRRKKFLKDLVDEYTGFSSILDSVHNTQGTRELREMFDDKDFFDFPKPKDLLKLFVSQGAPDSSDLVLDFFAGSGTTAHAVMELNAEDGGNRKWICVQLPEKCKEESEATKAGFDTIADIAKERIRRAGKKIEEEVSNHRAVYNGLRDEIGYKKREIGEIQAGDVGARYDFDFGFKVYKLDESNFKIWNTHVESQEQLEQQMIDFIDNVRGDSTQENLLHELILKSGQELTVPIETKKVDKAAYHRIGDGSLVICLDDISEKLFVEILADKPKKIVLLDRAFKGDDQLKTNMLLKAEDDGVDVLVV